MAVIQPPELTPLGSPAPQRGDRSTFRDRVDAFITWLIAAVVQFVALAANMAHNAMEAYNAALAAVAAAATVDASLNVTQWISGAVYAKGDKVWSPLDVRTYARSSPGGGVVDPSVDTGNWTLMLSSGPSSTNAQTISAMLTLTPESQEIQILTASVPGLGVKLPSANLLRIGKTYLAQNVGPHPIGIYDAANVLLKVVYPGGRAQVVCESIGSAAGAWHIMGSEIGCMLPVKEQVLVSSSITTLPPSHGGSLLKLSDTLAVHIGINGSTLYLAAHDLTTGQIGTPVAISGFYDAGDMCSYSITATRGAVFWGNINAQSYSGVAFAVTGTSIEVGAVQSSPNFTAGATSRLPNRLQIQVGRLGASTFLFCGAYSSANQPTIVAAAVTGNAIAFGDITPIGAQFAGPFKLMCMLSFDATRAVVLMSYIDTCQARLISVAGTVVTQVATSGSVTASQGAFTAFSNIVEMAAGEWWMATTTIGSSSLPMVLRVAATASTVSVGGQVLASVTGSQASALGESGPDRQPTLFKTGANTAMLAAGVSGSGSNFVAAAWKITYSAGFTSVVTNSWRAFIVQISHTGLVSHLLTMRLGLSSGGYSYDASCISIYTISADRFDLLADITIPGAGAIHHAMFFAGRLFLYSAAPSHQSRTETIVIDLAQGAVIERSVIKRSHGSASAKGRVELFGNKALFADALTFDIASGSQIPTGLYTTVLELAK